MGRPFHSAAFNYTWCRAANVSSSTSIHLLQGFPRCRTASETSIATTIWIVASRVPTKTDRPKAGSKEINFAMTLAMSLTRCLLFCMKASRMPRTLASLSSGTFPCHLFCVDTETEIFLPLSAIRQLIRLFLVHSETCLFEYVYGLRVVGISFRLR
jgi:hypothetical protein